MVGMAAQEVMAYTKLKGFCSNIIKKLAPPLLKEVQAAKLRSEAEGANIRRSKNFITHIKSDGVIVTDQKLKEQAFFEAYDNLLGNEQARRHTLDLQLLGIQSHILSDLEEMINEEEVWGVIKELPSDRAPSPDGFIGAFYHRACPIIKRNVKAVILKLYVVDGRGFTKLNKAHIVLVPKKPDAEEIGDYRPISLPHSIPMLFAKVLANRLRRRMKEIVGNNQSTFIEGRHLHDNFLLVWKVARRIHARKELEVFLKLDISRAFDSLSLLAFPI
ncbi:hypothetical protein D1007_21325 [Hordeum vulgare]|nr:hypothetical protein D1007_21325 [Hordeum vulgare]